MMSAATMRVLRFLYGAAVLVSFLACVLAAGAWAMAKPRTCGGERVDREGATVIVRGNTYGWGAGPYAICYEFRYVFGHTPDDGGQVEGSPIPADFKAAAKLQSELAHVQHRFGVGETAEEFRYANAFDKLREWPNEELGVEGKAGERERRFIRVFWLAVPFPALVLASGLLPLTFAMRKVRQGYIRWRRRRDGLCVACGYDLRCSPGRCPECGQSPATRHAKAMP
jgi:hypothetical protein